MSKASGPNGVVASVSDEASKVGIDILNRGGNAIDAAVAIAFAIGVTNPELTGLGGGGFLVYRSRDGATVKTLDFLERAPRAVTPDIFRRPGMHNPHPTDVTPVVSGHLVIGVPGMVAGMSEAIQLGSGRFSLGDLIAPAEQLARDGVEVPVGVCADAGNFARFNYYPETTRVYGPVVTACQTNQKFKNLDYARSLALIATYGVDAFYKQSAPNQYPSFVFNGHEYVAPAGGFPSLANLIIEQAMEPRRTGNEYYDPQSPVFNPVLVAKYCTNAHDRALVTYEDLASYRALWRQPVIGRYRGNDIITMGPPSCGTTMLEMLNIFQAFLDRRGYQINDLPPEQIATSWTHSSANHLHLLAEAQKIAWSDRSAYIGDPDPPLQAGEYFRAVPAVELTSEKYAQARSEEIDLFHAHGYSPGTFGEPAPPPGGAHNVGSASTHISVIDKDGNAVALTTGLGSRFGSIVVAPGTGFVFNSRLTDFDSLPPKSSSSSDLDVSEGKFEPAPDMQKPRELHTATLLDDGRVLLTGGLTSENGRLVATETAELYNPVPSPTPALEPCGATPPLPTASPTPFMSVKRFHHTATLLPDGTVLIAGGNGPQEAPILRSTRSLNTESSAERPDYYHKPTAHCELYHSASVRFIPLEPMNRVRSGHTATLLGNGKVLLAGGVTTDDGAITNTAELFDSASHTFSPVIFMTAARAFHTATLLPDGKVLIAGGIGADGKPSNTAELFDPTTPPSGPLAPSGSFTALPRMTSARSEHTATMLGNGKVLIAGGDTGTGPTDSAELFDPVFDSNPLDRRIVGGSFVPVLTPMAMKRSAHTSALLADNTVLIAGGKTDDGPTDRGEIYDPVTQTFTLLQSTMRTSRYYHKPTVVSDRNGYRVLLTGGAVDSAGQIVSQTADLFTSQGRVNEANGGKRPRSAMLPTIVADPQGRPILALGGAVGFSSVAGVAHTIMNVVDFGMDIPHAIDAERGDAIAWWEGDDAARPPNYLGVEDKRISAAVVGDWSFTLLGTTDCRSSPSRDCGELGRRGHYLDGRHFLAPEALRLQGPWRDDYHYLPFISAVGFNRRNGLHQGAIDPRGYLISDQVGGFKGASAQVLTRVVSRKTHGTAGTFDIDLNSSAGVESRSGGPSGDYQVVMNFVHPLTSVSTAKVTAGNATVLSAHAESDPREYIVNLTGVTNAQTIIVTLSGVNDGTTSTDVSIQMSVLAGDTNVDGRVNVGDANETKSRSGQLTDNSNARSDVNLDGRINVGDTNFVKAHSGSTLSRP